MLSFFLVSVNAQFARMEGVITGADHREGLFGVNIILKGTIIGTISGIHGDYILEDIPPGDYVHLYSYIGYKTITQEISLEPGETLTRNIELEVGPIDLSAVTIEAYQPFSAASSKAIRNFDLKIKPVRSAQDVLGLVPGLFIAQHARGGKRSRYLCVDLMPIMERMWAYMWMGCR